MQGFKYQLISIYCIYHIRIEIPDTQCIMQYLYNIAEILDIVNMISISMFQALIS